MIERCQMHINAFKGNTQVDIIEGDILTTTINNASMVVLNFTLQFIAPEQRDEIIKKIYQGLKPGGLLVLSEKMTDDDQICTDLLIDLHHNFKRANGYSELEISQKRNALENVMLTDTLPAHLSRLSKSGFSHISPWFQCFNFFSLLAIKNNV
jgi:tRNA (cmo5U34)-methyltransferase